MVESTSIVFSSFEPKGFQEGNNGVFPTNWCRAFTIDRSGLLEVHLFSGDRVGNHQEPRRFMWPIWGGLQKCRAYVNGCQATVASIWSQNHGSYRCKLTHIGIVCEVRPIKCLFVFLETLFDHSSLVDSISLAIKKHSTRHGFQQCLLVFVGARC